MKLRASIILGSSLLVASTNASLVGNLYLAQGSGQFGANIFDQVFADVPSASSVAANVVTVGGLGWNVSNIQAEFDDEDDGYVNSGPTGALLTVSTYGGTPSLNHTAGVGVGADIVYSSFLNATLVPLGNHVFNYVVDTTSISQLQGLAAGSYLVSLSLNSPNNVSGTGFHTTSTDSSMDGYIRNPGGVLAFPGGTGWSTFFALQGDQAQRQFSLGINGSNVVPEPASLAVIGLGALLLIRRKRK